MNFVNKDKSIEGFIAVTGGSVWYKIIGKDEGIPLIVLHGGPGYPHDYLEPLEDVGSEKKIIFYDQLGCGNSERSDNKSLWTVERFVEELSIVINTLKLDSYNIIGHSWGAALATSYALTKPIGLKSLILADPYLSTPIWERDANKLIQSLPLDIKNALLRHSEEGFTDTDEFKKASDEFYKQYVFRLDPLPTPLIKSNNKMNADIYTQMWGPKEFVASGSLKKLDLTSRLHEIKIPVLLICGRFDEATPEAGKQFKNLFPNAQLAIMENSAHMSHWTDREEFISTLINFLNNNN
jgi:proline iminopeptidase